MLFLKAWALVRINGALTRLPWFNERLFRWSVDASENALDAIVNRYPEDDGGESVRLAGALSIISEIVGRGVADDRKLATIQRVATGTLRDEGLRPFDVALRTGGTYSERTVYARDESAAMGMAIGRGPWTQPAVVVVSVGDVDADKVRAILRDISGMEHLRGRS